MKDGAGVSKTEQLAKFLKDGKKIIISTVQTFPFVLEASARNIAARSSPSSSTRRTPARAGARAAAMSEALSAGRREDEDETTEDKINRIIEARKMLPNASYFAFTATPKNKTLEMFGMPYPDGGEVKHRPFHSYTMKQAIQEGFILDVLKTTRPWIAITGWRRRSRATRSST